MVKINLNGGPMVVQKNAVNSVKANTPYKKGLHKKLTRELLEHMHWVDGLSMVEIGAKYGVTSTSIKYWMNKFGMRHRSTQSEILFEASPALSYVIGMLHGDAFLYYNRANKHHVVQLNITDKPIAESFSRALQIIGIRSTTMERPPEKQGPRNKKIVYDVRTCSKGLHDFINGFEKSDLIKFALQYPQDYIRAVYESEGSLKWNKASWELCIYSTNVLMQECIFKTLLSKGYNPKWFSRKLESGKTFVYVQLFRNLEIKRFLAWANPCVKIAPRSDANTEPSWDRNVSEGVESTKDDKSCHQVDSHEVTYAE